MAEQNPLVAFDPQEPSTVIRFDVPLPSSFEGKNAIDLRVKHSEWNEGIRESIGKLKKSTETDQVAFKALLAVQKDKPELSDQTQALMHRLESPAVERIISTFGPDAEIILSEDLKEFVKPSRELKGVGMIKAHELRKYASKIPDRMKLEVNSKMNGKCTGDINSVMRNPMVYAKEAMPRLFVIEKYRLENYLGNYGMGKTISSFYVHPKSVVDLAVKSWTAVEESYNESSSIFDSLTLDASDRFESTFNSERSRTEEVTSSSSYYAEVKAKAGFLGIASVEAKAGARGSSTSARSEFSRDVSSTVRAHASASSSTRVMQHNVASSTQVSEGSETTLIRKIRNLNEGHVLNFLIRELNQEYHSVLVLKDVRLAFIFGNAIMEEVPLYKAHELLWKFLRHDDRGASVEAYLKYILKEYSYVQDYRGVRKSIFDIVHCENDRAYGDIDEGIEAYNPNDHYIRIKQYRDHAGERGDRRDEKCGIGKYMGGRADGEEIKVAGIPLAVNTITLKTDGVICSSLLDPGLALGEHSCKLRSESYRKEKAEADLLEAQVAEHKMAQDLVNEGGNGSVDNFVKIFGQLSHAEEDED